MNEFLEEFGDEAARAVSVELGVQVSPPRLDSRTAAELLELTRVVAHERERRLAPLSSYLVGVAVGSAGALDADQAFRLVQSIRVALESK